MSIRLSIHDILRLAGRAFLRGHDGLRERLCALANAMAIERREFIDLDDLAKELAKRSLAVLLALGLASSSALADHPARSGSSCVGDRTRGTGFAAWRGSPLEVAVGWAPWDSWSTMLGYMSGTQPRRLKQAAPMASIGVGLFPKGGTLASCAAGKYAVQHRDIGSRLVANGAGDVELRLGWESNLSNYPWHAVGRSATQWRQCFTNAAKAIKSAAPNVRIAWHMGKKGRIDVATIWPADAPISTISVSHYDDDHARFGTETYKGSPWGLRAWLAFARARGKPLALGEWGVGRRGDNPAYIEAMHAFLVSAGSGVAHEAYFNCGSYALEPSTRLPKSAALYRSLW